MVMNGGQYGSYDPAAPGLGIEAAIAAAQARAAVTGAGGAPVTARPHTRPTPPPQLLPGQFGVGMGAGLGLLPAVLPVATAIAPYVPAVATGVGIAGAAWGLLQALGLGEGEGIFGFDVFGGDTGVLQVPGQDIPLQGPGLAEPEPKYIVWEKHYPWGNMYRLNIRGKTVMARWSRTKGWKTWVPMKMAVIGKKIPTHKSLTRLRRLLKKHQDDAKTILKITQPSALTAYATRKTQYYKKK